MTNPPPSAPPSAPRPAGSGPRRHTAKALQIIFIILGTMVAGVPISDIIAEREARQEEVREDFRTSWGPEQTVQIPLLAVPYVRFTDWTAPLLGAGGPREYLILAPETASARVVLAPEERRRGLFTATVYEAAVQVTGRFAIPSQARLDALVEGGMSIQWEDAILVMRTTRLGSMTAKDHVTWNGASVPWQSCVELMAHPGECRPETLVARPPLTAPPAAGQAVPFQAAVTVRGSGAFALAPEGPRVTAVMEAPWSTPSFYGATLPSDTTISPGTFAAQWRVVDSSRPLLWSTAALKDAVAEKRFSPIGVQLLEATPVYRMVTRATKYAVLFVVLSFALYALFELLGVVRITVVQYGLMGVSLTLFALLLVSLAEPLGYRTGYWISAGLVTAQASLYTASVTRRRFPTLLFTASLSALFIFLYVLLGMETYALLTGTLALFLALCAAMVVTQRLRRRGDGKAVPDGDKAPPAGALHAN